MHTPLSNPPDIARETLKTLALRKIPPTPDNYNKIYAEIGGIASNEDAGAQQVLQKLADTLSKQTGKSADVGNQLLLALASQNWATYLLEVEKILPTAQDGGATTLAWSELIRNLLRQLERPHKGLTIPRKREGLDTVLSRFANNPHVLFEKLQGLIRSWSETPSSNDSVADSAIPATSALPASSVVSSPFAQHEDVHMQLRELLAQTLESTLGAQPEFTAEVNAFALQIRSSLNYDEITQLAKKLRQFWLKVELRGGDKIKIQEGLVRLLRLLVENVGELVEDEEWLHGQIETLQQIVNNPVDKRIIADAERSLRDAIIKQSLLKQSLKDAKLTLKSLMTTFIDRLGDLTESTGDYHQKIANYSQKISTTNNITELSHLLDDIMQDTRVIQASALRSHEELVSTRKRVIESEEKIKQLEQELEQVSEMVHEDQLTGMLNRRGLDDAFERESTRADRNALPLCVALLDIDNFKRLNDTLGHQAGDGALIHLSSVIKEALRPSDSVARYGGEEFVIILPDTELDKAYETIVRLQRELTRQFFLHSNERVLITFSAGVALRAPQEDQESVVGRADKAMYQAKQGGKNQVVVSQ